LIGTNLTTGYPYLIEVTSLSAQFETYQFRAELLQPATLSGTVSLTGLAPLTSSNISYTEIHVYTDASSPFYLGSTMADSGGSWSIPVPASESQAVTIVAYIHLDNGLFIPAQRQDTINGDSASLDLAPTAVSLAGGQTVTRVSGNSYDDWFLFVPAAGGFFNLGAISGNSTPAITLYDAVAGTELVHSNSGSLYTQLSAGTPYIVRVSNIGNFTAYQFQLSSPITSTAIGGSVSYSGLPGSVSSIISSATVSGYLDNPANTQIFSGAPVSGGVWSALIPSNAAGQTARLILTLNLNNGLRIASHIETVLSGTGIDFSPTGIASGTAINSRSDVNGVGRLLFVPESSGTFALQAASEPNTAINVYDAVTGLAIGSVDYSWSFATLEVALSAGKPYIIEVFTSAYLGYGHIAYQFSTNPVPPVTLGGIVDFSGVSSWSANSAGMFVFLATHHFSYNTVGTGTVSLPGGAWSISASTIGETFFTMVALSSGGEGVLATQTVNVSGDNISNINFSPEDSNKNVATGSWHNRSVSIDSREDWLLWIPDTTGEYVLRVEMTGDGFMHLGMYLYDGLTGAEIAFDNQSSDYSSIQRNDFVGGNPYLVRVVGYSGSDAFRFKAEAVSSP
jgi:hypothetical protein